MTFNPALQYFGQVITDKITNREDKYEMPKMNPAILEYVRPDREMFESAAEQIREFDSVFKLEKVDLDDKN
jgi:hypothetical protein